jgi:hypothetical protein
MLKNITFTKVFIGYGLKRAWVSTLAQFYFRTNSSSFSKENPFSVK